MAAPPPPRVREQQVQDSEESSSPPCCGDLHEVQMRIQERLRRMKRRDQPAPSFDRRLARHLRRMPPRYLADVDADDKAEDVLLHWGILDECDDPDKRPVFHARYVKSVMVWEGGEQELDNKPFERLMEDLSLERRKAMGASPDYCHHPHVSCATVDKCRYEELEPAVEGSEAELCSLVASNPSTKGEPCVGWSVE